MEKTSIDFGSSKNDKYDLPWFNRPQITVPDNLPWIIYIENNHFYG